MSVDQGPEAPTIPAGLLADTADPEAPWGRRPNGQPYKRDPGPFAGLRGKPFGSMNGSGKPATPRASSSKSTAKRATVQSPPKDTPEGYAKRFRGWFRGAARFTSRRAPVPAAIIAVRSEEMAEAWGRVAVSYPKVGRFVDRIGKGGDLSDAIGGTVMTLVMIAHVQGLTQGTPIADLIDDAVHEVLDRFATEPEYEKQRQQAAQAAAARHAAARQAETEATGGDGSAD